jgi:predicted Fe-S protein YdhL (DUF1289 family)
MPSDIPSPCTSVCTIDEATRWCAGCLRTIDEIAAWGSLDDVAKRAVLERLPARRAERDLRDVVARSNSTGRATAP